MKIIIDNNYKWKRVKIGEYLIHYIGHFEGMHLTIRKITKLGENLSSEKLDIILNELTVPAAVIMESAHTIVAFTDRFRCYPVFYTTTGNGSLSNSARKLKTSITGSDWDVLSVEEFSMAGYVTGSDTLIRDLKQLQTGERMIVKLSNNHIDIERYYRYSPAEEEYRSNDEWIDELEVVMDGVTQRMIERADGRPIMAPLSAGLDSRLLVSKLHEAGYDNLKTFSYGPPGNWEMRGAKKVAECLNLSWRPVPISMQEGREMFWTPERRASWNFSDGLSSLPFMQEFNPISKLHSMGGLSDDTVLINGQSGDFITGGHIPKILIQPGADVHTLLDCITSKHYSLWKNLKTPERLKRVEEKIIKLLGVSVDAKLTPEELSSLYERWECEERQAKWVINGQRVYDFFGYDWQLPLWDTELVNFFQKVPIHLKTDQKLYRLWLKRWNYKNLFDDFNPTVWRWPGATLAVVPLAKGVEFLLGKRAKQAWYELFFYWGHTAEHYAPYSYAEYFKIRKIIRNSITLQGRTWAQENSLPKELIDLGQ